ncbi:MULTISPECIES: ABC transporter ATP-binding protein/permease [unclassified Microbacterium]|uniref:ABC transporter ATP-binding protein/permease n=1 Tax=unclassified Microbacterium TaxID=2609290 RepID=UPI000EAA71BE|nr:MULTISPECIES: ATP-binding cassette domain-containing protein [unclassified Microbacterium]MBT2484727.1 ATP-binding cassette domain-containing protein [Microbacterium sp. ISL-108]RKN67610.1 ATP-binding cassette domain-containing protein [Microbacterium sp. CGR2]
MIHRRLLQLAGAVPGAVLALAIVGLLISTLQVAFALSLSTVIVTLTRGEGDVLLPLGLLAALTILRGAVIWAREPLAVRIGASVRIALRRRLLDRLALVPAAERDSGALSATVIDGVDGLDAYYTRYLPQLLIVLVVPATIVIIATALSPAAGIALAGAAAIAVLAPRAWDSLLLKNGRTRWDRFARLTSAYIEALQNIPLLRGFGASGRTATQLALEAEVLRRSTMSQLRLSLVETAVSALAMHLGVILAVLAAASTTFAGDASAATVVTVLLLARECFRPVQDLGVHWHAGYLGLNAVDGLDRLLSLTPAVPEHGTQDHPAQTGDLHIMEASYRYPRTGSGVRGIELRIADGERVAVLGASGSGKSTLARLLEREMDPSAGSICLDGVDLRRFTARARSRSVVVVPQDPVLFAWSVRDNLRLFRPDADDAEIVAAAQAADVHAVVSALPNGYDTLLAENGEQLSGGQRQRLAIARALLSPARLLVLDEVTSALDTDTERRVMDGVAAAAQDRTIVFIAHRESACAHATRWIALEDGRLSDSGSGPPPVGALARQGGR